MLRHISAKAQWTGATRHRRLLNDRSCQEGKDRPSVRGCSWRELQPMSKDEVAGASATASMPAGSDRPRALTHGRAVGHLTVGGDLQVVETDYAADLALHEHVHPEASINVALAGGFTEAIDGVVLECKTLTLHYRPAEVPHSNRYSRAGARCLTLAASAAVLERRAGGALPQRALVTTGALAVMALGLHRELSCGHPASFAIGIDELLARLASLGRDRDDRPEPSPAPPWLKRVREALHASGPDHPPRLAELALLASVHPVYLARTFRVHFGCSIGDYIRRLRVECAIRLLRSGGRSIADVATQSGFFDQSHLSRCFRRETGIPPSAFLRALQRQ